jgi:hypothetical protein
MKKDTKDTPLDALLELVDWHTPEMDRIIMLTEPPTGGGCFQGNFWLWCWRQGFPCATGSENYFQSHGWYLDPKDRKPFRRWLKRHLASLEIHPTR